MSPCENGVKSEAQKVPGTELGVPFIFTMEGGMSHAVDSELVLPPFMTAWGSQGQCHPEGGPFTGHMTLWELTGPGLTWSPDSTPEKR